MIDKEKLKEAVRRLTIDNTIMPTQIGGAGLKEHLEADKLLIDLAQSVLDGKLVEPATNGELRVIISTILQESMRDKKKLTEIISRLANSFTGKVSKFQRKVSVDTIEGIIERNQIGRRFIIEHDKDLPTAQMITQLALAIHKAIYGKEKL